MGQKQLSDGRVQVDIRDVHNTRRIRIFQTDEEATRFIGEILKTHRLTASRQGNTKKRNAVNQGVAMRTPRL